MLIARLFSASARQRLFAFASLILLMIFFSFASSAFMQTDNIIGILQSTTVVGVLAVASTFVIITAGIDLSVGCLMTFTAVMAGVFLVYWGLPLWIGILGAIGTGALSGTLSGTFVAKLKLPPFIATLGMMLVNKGLALVVAQDKPIYFTDIPSFSVISQGSLIGYVLPFVPIPNGVLILFAIAFAASIVLNRTALGRYTFALGSNEEAVRLSGVNVDRWKIIIYALGGGICGVAGLLIASRLELGTAGARPGLRARRHRRGGRRRDVAFRRHGHDPGHDHRRLHHQRAHQRAAHPVGGAGMADRGDRRHHHPGRLYRHAAAQEGVTRHRSAATANTFTKGPGPGLFNKGGST